MTVHSVNDGTQRHHVAFMVCESALEVKEYNSNVKSVATPQTSVVYCDSIKFIVNVFIDSLFTFVQFI